jgi:hypothetical protein
MGFELEVECKKDRTDTAENLIDFAEGEDHFYIKEDGSLSNGIEIATHPHTLEKHKSYGWDKVTRFLSDAKCTSHNTQTCGLHVHVNRSFLSAYTEQVRLGIFVSLNRNKFEVLSRRTESNYAKFKDLKLYGIKSANSNDTSRYEAINWNNYDTIEFRMFKGTLKFETLMATLELVDAVCRWIKTTTTIQCVKPEAFGCFIAWVLADKTYEYLPGYVQSKNLIANNFLSNSTINQEV